MATRLRPYALFPWFTPLSSLKGVGPSTLNAFERLLMRARGAEGNVLSVRDLLFHIPHDVIDRSKISTIDAAEIGQYVTLKLRIESHIPPPHKRARVPYRIVASDASNSMFITYFQARADVMSNMLPIGQERYVCGVIDMYDGMKQISHPDMVAPLYKEQEVMRLHPIYGLVAGLSQRVLSKFIVQALALLKPLNEWANAELISQQQWSNTIDALRALHTPQSLNDMVPDAPARLRLAYDEALANQLALTLLRRTEHEVISPLVSFDAASHARYVSVLPFTLTGGQCEVIEAIAADMASGARMLRLLQGDVGSGKTIVALAAMVQVASAKGQSALMAPTDLLARQHYATLAPLAEMLGLRCVLLTGKLPISERKSAQVLIASGDAAIVIGTHALFQTSVDFAALKLVVVDEQHRFGVQQRMRLSEKGQAPHLLQMSATPIPRSLTMTAYGDMDVSLLTEKPEGRQPIDTRIIALEREVEIVDGVARALDKGQKIYWICPLIEQADKDSTQADMAAVEERFRVLSHRFGDKVGMVHGRMKPAQREDIMARFAFGDMQLLVATTVIEVGVNVPAATIMIIEHAERFGLAQLHQLRGRVGRGSELSSCLLLYSSHISDISKQRLATIRTSNDGFFIAEEDLRLRGAGDVLGTRQTGLPAFHFVDLLRHQSLISTARNDARHLLASDPQLTTERGQACRLLLALFGYDEEVAALRSV